MNLPATWRASLTPRDVSGMMVGCWNAACLGVLAVCVVARARSSDGHRHRLKGGRVVRPLGALVLVQVDDAVRLGGFLEREGSDRRRLYNTGLEQFHDSLEMRSVAAGKETRHSMGNGVSRSYPGSPILFHSKGSK